MDIHPLNSNVLVGSSLPRQNKNAAPEGTSVNTQPTDNSVQSQYESALSLRSSAPASREQLDSAVKAANDFVSSVNSSLEFSVDKETDRFVVKVVDINTKEVIRQIPSEEMLNIAKALDTIKGLLIYQKA